MDPHYTLQNDLIIMTERFSRVFIFASLKHTTLLEAIIYVVFSKIFSFHCRPGLLIR